ncbi:hypothetical protein BZZ08_03841 [Streptomyces sp. MH60]|nr:hypothetical protein BZZ08_03841 [Streptomyces sp. MH60]
MRRGRGGRRDDPGGHGVRAGRTHGRRPLLGVRQGRRALAAQRADAGEDLARGGPVGRVLGEAVGDQGTQRRVGDGVHVRGVVHHAVEQRGRRSGAEGVGAGRREGQHRAQAEHVAGPGDLVPVDLLRGHEARGTRHVPGAGEGVGVDAAHDAEVDDARPVLGEQHVGGLEVAVDEVRGVDRHQRLGQPGGQREHRLRFERPPLGHRLLQGRSGDVAGDQPGQRRVRVGVDDRGGEGAADHPGGLDLASEAVAELRSAQQFGVHHLDRDEPASRGPAEEDPAHAAHTQPAQQPVLPDGARVVRLQR